MFNIFVSTFGSLYNRNKYKELTTKYGSEYKNRRDLNFLVEILDYMGYSAYINYYYSDENLIKTYFSDILVDMFEKYGNINPSNSRTFNNSITTNTSLIPSNYHMYLYIIPEIRNKVYEYAMKCDSIEFFLTSYCR